MNGSLMATTSTLGFSMDARSTKRPMRPKPVWVVVYQACQGMQRGLVAALQGCTHKRQNTSPYITRNTYQRRPHGMIPTFHHHQSPHVQVAIPLMPIRILPSPPVFLGASTACARITRVFVTALIGVALCAPTRTPANALPVCRCNM